MVPFHRTRHARPCAGHPRKSARLASLLVNGGDEPGSSSSPRAPSAHGHFPWGNRGSRCRWDGVGPLRVSAFAGMTEKEPETKRPIHTVRVISFLRV
jgi:hypothetical protein